MSWLVRMELDKTALDHCPFRDSYAWHQAVWECFPDIPDAGRDFLTRMDCLPHRYRIYLLCRREPVRPDWCPSEAWAIKNIVPSFLQHESYAFDLLSNPTRKIRAHTADGERIRNGKRVALLDDVSRRKWLSTKAEQHGFCLDGAFSVEDAGVNVFRRNARVGTHIGVRFRGCLRVTDRERFIHTFYHGIGSAKAFGFGMLLLQPIWQVRITENHYASSGASYSSICPCGLSQSR